MGTLRRCIHHLTSIGLVIIAGVLLQSCGHGNDTNNEVKLASLSNILTMQGAAVQSNAKLSSAAALVLANKGGAPGTLAITYSDGTVVQLMSDPKDKTHFWMPIVTETKSGVLTLTQDGIATASLPVALSPYVITAAPGLVTLNYLYANSVKQQVSIDFFANKPEYASALAFLMKSKQVIDQQIVWVTAAINDGSTTIDYPWAKTGTATLDQTGLKLMDQVVMGFAAQFSPAQVPLASSMTLGNFLLSAIPSAHADTYSLCTKQRPSGLPAPTSLQEDQAWCTNQVHTDSIEEIANYMQAVATSLQLGGAILAFPTPPVGLAFIAIGKVISANADLLNVLASAANGRGDKAIVKGIVAVIEQSLGNFLEDLKILAPTFQSISKEIISSFVDTVKSVFGDNMKQIVDSVGDHVLAALDAPPPVTPTVPPTDGPTSPPLGSADFSVSKALVCKLGDNGSASVTGQLLATLLPGEQITISMNTSSYYTGNDRSCGSAESYVAPAGVRIPSYQYAGSNCIPPTGLELHPDYFATCLNPGTSGVARSVAVDIATGVNAEIIGMSSNIIVFACRATTMNFNTAETFNKARPGTTLHLPLACTTP